MDVIFESLINTEWGVIILGVILLIAILILFFNNDQTPQI